MHKSETIYGISMTFFFLSLSILCRQQNPAKQKYINKPIEIIGKLCSIWMPHIHTYIIYKVPNLHIYSSIYKYWLNKTQREKKNPDSANIIVDPHFSRAHHHHLISFWSIRIRNIFIFICLANPFVIISWMRWASSSKMNTNEYSNPKK